MRNGEQPGDEAEDKWRPHRRLMNEQRTPSPRRTRRSTGSAPQAIRSFDTADHFVRQKASVSRGNLVPGQVRPGCRHSRQWRSSRPAALRTAAAKARNAMIEPRRGKLATLPSRVGLSCDGVAPAGRNSGNDKRKLRNHDRAPPERHRSQNSSLPAHIADEPA